MNAIRYSILLAIVTGCRAAGTSTDTKNEMESLPVIQKIQKSITFIYATNDLGEEAACGTGFFVSVPGKANRAYGYLVTAKHVLTHVAFPVLKKPAGIYDQVRIRLNRKDGGAEMLSIDLSKPNAVFTHRDDSVDLAAIPLFPDLTIYDVMFCPDNLAVKRDSITKFKIRPGDNVFFGGLFTPFMGAKRNYPIMRFGKVAMLPDERIPVAAGKSSEFFLIEAQAWGGNSGAPVFFDLEPSRDPGQIVLGPTKIFLAGVMEGFFHVFSPLVTTKNQVPGINDNTGIAAVTPAYLLTELLQDFAVRLQRDQ